MLWSASARSRCDARPPADFNRSGNDRTDLLGTHSTCACSAETSSGPGADKPAVHRILSELLRKFHTTVMVELPLLIVFIKLAI